MEFPDFVKADPSIRDTIWRAAGWNFYIDGKGDVHTSRSETWSEKHLVPPGRCTHNHWLKDKGMSIGPNGVLIRECNPSLENK